MQDVGCRSTSREGGGILLIAALVNAFVADHAGLAFGLACDRGSYHKMDLLCASMRNAQKDSTDECPVRHAYEWWDYKADGGPLAWAMEPMEEHGFFLSRAAQVPNLKHGSDDRHFFSGTSAAVMVSPCER